MLQKLTKTKKEVGLVVATQDYIINLHGLPSARLYDMLVTKNGGRAIVSALSKDTVEALMVDAERAKPGEYLELTGSRLTLPMDVNLFGRAINPLGVPLDGKGALPPRGNELDLDAVAPGIDSRAKVKEQFYTGVTIIDTLIPLGEGQRELILCEPRSGRELLFLDIIASKKGKDVICIYAGCGRSEVEIRRFAQEVDRIGADGYTVIVAGTSNSSAPLITIAPSIALSLAEHYRDQGKNIVVIIDDLSTHAKYAREIALLAKNVPGRESYPADIFYQHSTLVERAGKFNEHWQNGTITLLPVIETSVENFTNLIPTNVMSMTDGHLLMVANLHAQGIYPAVEIERSVTRVGKQTQVLIHKILSDKIRSMLAEYQELERFSKFGSELSPETQLKIKRGKAAEELIHQTPLSPIDPGVQILMMTFVFTGVYDKVSLDKLKSKKKELLNVLSASPYIDLVKDLKALKFDELVTKLKGMTATIEALWQESKP